MPDNEFELERVGEVANLDDARALDESVQLGLVLEALSSTSWDVLAARQEVGIGYLPHAAVDAAVVNGHLAADSCRVSRVITAEAKAIPRVWIVLQ